MGLAMGRAGQHPIRVSRLPVSREESELTSAIIWHSIRSTSIHDRIGRFFITIIHIPSFLSLSARDSVLR